MVAFIIDAVIVSVAIFVVVIAFSLLLGPAVSFQAALVTVDRGRAMLDAAAASAINFLYFVGLWTTFRATLGQRLLKFEVVSASGGEKAALGQSVTRWLLLGGPAVVAGVAAALGQGLGSVWIDFVVMAWYLALLVTTALSPTKRGLHDRASRTIVTKAARAVRFDEPGDGRTPVVR